MGAKVIILIAVAIFIIAAASVVYLENIGGVRDLIRRESQTTSGVQPTAQPTAMGAAESKPEEGKAEELAKIIEILRKRKARMEMDEEALKARLRSLQSKIEEKLRELEKLERQIVQRMEQLKALEQEVRLKMAQQEVRINQIQEKSTAQESQTISQQELKKLAKGYQDMRASKAAELLSQIAIEGDEELVLDILRSMDKSTALEILSNFKDKSQAAKLQIGLLRVEASEKDGS
jgi:flagellar motility protein MotE (MotC chaperone)